MKELVKKSLQKILEDKDLLKKLFYIDDFDEVYNLLVSKGFKHSKEDLAKYFIDMNRKNSIISEDELDNTSGGIINKNLSKALAASLTLLTLGDSPLIMAHNEMLNTPTSSSIKDSSINLRKKALEITKNHKGKLITLGMGMLLASGYLLLNSTDDVINVNDIINEYLCGSENYNISQISANSWFTKLGGTDADIDAYKRCIASCSNKSNEIPGLDEQLSVDIDRAPTYARDHKALFVKILSAYFKNNSKHKYTQGWDSYCYMLYYKFSAGATRKITVDEEAKIYYLYGKILDALCVFDPADLAGISRKVKESYSSISNSNFNKLYDMMGRIVESRVVSPPDPTKNTLNCEEVQTLSMLSYYMTGCIRLVTEKQIIHIWDKIITSDTFINGNNFDAQRVQHFMCTLINSIMCHLYDVQNINGRPEMNGLAVWGMIQRTSQELCKELEAKASK